jgi:hypothetical protein
MKARLTLPALLVLLLSAALSSCFGSPLLMPGLSLPPGSNVINQTNSTTTQGANPFGGLPVPGGAQIPGMGDVDKTVMVTFDNPGGWGAVTSHLDAFMTGKGYSDPMAAMSGMSQGMPGGAAANAQMQSAMAGMRSYFKMGEKYTVMVMDNSVMMGAAGAGINPMGGQFSLMVMKYK